ncbi:hypothetical protein ACFL2O_02820 [Thermodesulfobacteriota bacterium]
MKKIRKALIRAALSVCFAFVVTFIFKRFNSVPGVIGLAAFMFGFAYLIEYTRGREKNEQGP